jgi:hypothetical protein
LYAGITRSAASSVGALVTEDAAPPGSRRGLAI